MRETTDAVAIVICEACGDRPSNVGDVGGNAFRWQDYRPIAEKAIAATDAAKDAEIAELRTKLAASEASDAESIAMYRKARDERDEARECVRALCSVLEVIRDADCSNSSFDAGKALAATPEHLRK